GRELFGYMGHGVAPCFVGLIELLVCMNVVLEMEFDAVGQIALFWPSGAALAAQLRTLERKRRIERLERQIVQVRQREPGALEDTPGRQHAQQDLEILHFN